MTLMGWHHWLTPFVDCGFSFVVYHAFETKATILFVLLFVFNSVNYDHPMKEMKM